MLLITTKVYCKASPFYTHQFSIIGNKFLVSDCVNDVLHVLYSSLKVISGYSLHLVKWFFLTLVGSCISVFPR
jgi:hypothetical protein